MKIYFNASVSARPTYEPTYRRIVEILTKLGHQVTSDNVFSYTPEGRQKESPEERHRYYEGMKKRIKSTDLMVAEISFPSTVHVGHELTLALNYNKPVLALYNHDHPPVLFSGLEEERFLVEPYTEKDLDVVIKNALSYLSEQTDTRFNFFISTKHQNYLNRIASERRIPRSVYLRQLIENDMEQNVG